MENGLSNSKSLGKFHKFVWFVWMPLSFLFSVYRAISFTESFLINYSPFETGGLVLTIFIATFLMEVVFVAAPVLIFIGFFNNKKYSWFVLVLESASNVVFFPILLMRKASAYDGATILGKILGVALDVFIVVYYWQRKELFSVGIKGRCREAPSQAIHEKREFVYCSNCGQRVSADSKYCNKCGFEI